MQRRKMAFAPQAHSTPESSYSILRNSVLRRREKVAAAPIVQTIPQMSSWPEQAVLECPL